MNLRSLLHSRARSVRRPSGDHVDSRESANSWRVRIKKHGGMRSWNDERSGNDGRSINRCRSNEKLIPSRVRQFTRKIKSRKRLFETRRLWNVRKYWDAQKYCIITSFSPSFSLLSPVFHFALFGLSILDYGHVSATRLWTHVCTFDCCYRRSTGYRW